MATINSAKSFLKILEKSGIIEQDRLKSALNELSTRFKGQVVRLDDLTTYLAEKKLISKWHLEKLLSGRYKGFFWGNTSCWTTLVAVG